jgi:APA family basic amino acid/polyamine antiporter
VPAFATAFGASLITILLLFNYSGAPSLVGVFNITILLATLANLIPFVFCSLAEILMRRIRGDHASLPKHVYLISGVAFVYSCWAIYGAGAETVMQGILLLLAGIPVYVWLRKREG